MDPSEQTTPVRHIKMEMIELLSKEYHSLRVESMDTIKNRTQIVSLGLAAVGVLFAAPLSDAINGSGTLAHGPLLTTFVYSVFIPVVCATVVTLWLGELRRMDRAGNYMCMIEARINQALCELGMIPHGSQLVAWEHWLREGRTTKLWPWADAGEKDGWTKSPAVKSKGLIEPYWATLSLFQHVSFLSVFLAVVVFAFDPETTKAITTLLVEPTKITLQQAAYVLCGPTIIISVYLTLVSSSRARRTFEDIRSKAKKSVERG